MVDTGSQYNSLVRLSYPMLDGTSIVRVLKIVNSYQRVNSCLRVALD